MRLLDKLLRALGRAFDTDPAPFLAFRIDYDGAGMVWTVADGQFTTAVTGGSGAGLSLALAGSSVAQLAAAIAAQPGYSVAYVNPDLTLTGLSALVLLDASGDPGLSNGDHVYGYTNDILAWSGAAAAELGLARAAIEAMPDEMATTTADGVWLDYLASYYAVPRQPGETDAAFGPRIVAETLLPKGNNVAIAEIITAVIGQPARVVDVVEHTAVEPLRDGSITHDGSHLHNSGSQPIYGLFDVTVGQDLLGMGLPIPTAMLQALVERVRDAGTQLRAIAGMPSVLTDAGPHPAGDVASMTVNYPVFHNGGHRRDGSIRHAPTLAIPEVLLG